MAELSRIETIIQALLDSGSIEEAWDIHVRAMAEYGFDRLLFATTRFRTFGELGDVEDALILTNHHPDYVEAFFGSDLYMHAPLVRWVANNTTGGFVSWRVLEDMRRSGDLTQKEREVMRLNARFGVTAGFSISYETPSDRVRGGIGLCARADLTQDNVEEVWAEHGAHILLLNKVFHLRVNNLPHHGQRRPLTARQREALYWYGEGKTVQDISAIMGVSAATVEKHLRKARETLNVETTAQAVMKASLQNQFFKVGGD